MHKTATDDIRQLDNVLNQRYSERLHKFGADPRTLGWDSLQHQHARFAAACRFLPSEVNALMDIGCGLGDFLDFLCNHTDITIAHYRGVDINPEFITHCGQQKKNIVDHVDESAPNTEFLCTNILTDTFDLPRVQWATMFGLLNLKLSELDNYTYAFDFIERAFSLVEDGLIVDLLSCHYEENYLPEDFVFYYSPVRVVDFALTLTPHVSLLQDYESIPQREFMVVLRKSPVRLQSRNHAEPACEQDSSLTHDQSKPI